VTLLDDLIIPQSSITLVTADVKDMYPSIPIQDGLNALYLTLVRAKWDKPKILFIIALAEAVLRNNIFEFNGRYFVQIHGTAMGTSFAVAYANIYLHVLELEVMQQFKSVLPLCELPLINKRYIDDIFALFPSNQSAETYFSLFNSARESIKLLPSYGESVDVLDLTIYKGARFSQSSKLDVKLYQKEINKYIYIPPDSFHRVSSIRGFISSELKRYRLCCTDDINFTIAKDNFYSRLQARGYSRRFLKPLFNHRYERSVLLSDINELSHSTSTIPTVFKLPYTPRFTHKQLKQLLEIPTELLQHPHFISVFGAKQPVICYKRTRNINELLNSKNNV
jgi:hypothetical protein